MSAPPSVTIPDNDAIVAVGVKPDGTKSGIALDADGKIITTTSGGSADVNVTDRAARLLGVVTGAAAAPLALDATLTGGTAQSIARGGAKGATTAATVTSTAIDADHQALDVAVKVSALPTGAATSALQGGGLPAALGAGGGLKVDGSGTALPVSGTLTTTSTARIPRVAHLASAALPAAGAFTSQTAYAIPDGVRGVAFYVTYTRGAVGGYPKARLMIGNGKEEGPPLLLDGTITSSAPYGQRAAYIDEIKPGPTPADGSAITYVIYWTVTAGETTIRLLLAEAGVTATPGTAAIGLTAQYA